mmetsp:Transcript_44638/g.100904  ORF Transcript_44638/g.100904 Transcript_44638/m.100904 type:complete len:88 (-) Transcript_44638:31-294(-)
MTCFKSAPDVLVPASWISTHHDTSDCVVQAEYVALTADRRVLLSVWWGIVTQSCLALGVNRRGVAEVFAAIHRPGVGPERDIFERPI